PINTLHGAFGAGCSVDPLTSDVAVTNQDTVLIWHHASGSPTTVSYPGHTLQYCGYDASGDLFADMKHEGSFLLKLPYGGASFSELTISKSIGEPGQVQWDGSH